MAVVQSAPWYTPLMRLFSKAPAPSVRVPAPSLDVDAFYDELRENAHALSRRGVPSVVLQLNAEEPGQRGACPARGTFGNYHQSFPFEGLLGEEQTLIKQNRDYSIMRLHSGVPDAQGAVVPVLSVANRYYIGQSRYLPRMEPVDALKSGLFHLTELAFLTDEKAIKQFLSRYGQPSWNCLVSGIVDDATYQKTLERMGVTSR